MNDPPKYSTWTVEEKRNHLAELYAEHSDAEHKKNEASQLMRDLDILIVELEREI